MAHFGKGVVASVGIKENGKGSKSRFTSSRSVPHHFLGAALQERLMIEGLNESSSFPQFKSSARRQRARMLERGVGLGRNTTSCRKAHAWAMCSTTRPGMRS